MLMRLDPVLMTEVGGQGGHMATGEVVVGLVGEEEIEGIESAGIVKALFKLRDATESFLNLTLSPLFNL